MIKSKQIVSAAQQPSVAPTGPTPNPNLKASSPPKKAPKAPPPKSPSASQDVLAGLPPMRPDHPLPKQEIKRLHQLCSILKRRPPTFHSWRRTLREILDRKLFLAVAADFDAFCRLLDLPVEAGRFAADPNGYNCRSGNTGSGTISPCAPEVSDGGPVTAPSANTMIAGDKSSTQTPDRISLKHKIAMARAAEAQAATEAMASPEEDERKLEPLKTYLVKYGIRTTGFCDYRDDFSIGVVQAANLYAAYENALKLHASEAFDEDEEEFRGEWVEVQSKSAVRLGFELGDDYPDVDAGCLLWIEKLVEVEPSDVSVVERYLADW